MRIVKIISSKIVNLGNKAKKIKIWLNPSIVTLVDMINRHLKIKILKEFLLKTGYMILIKPLNMIIWNYA